LTLEQNPAYMVWHSERAEVYPFFHTNKPLRFYQIDEKRQNDDHFLLADLRKRSRQASTVPWKLYENATVTVKDIMSELPDMTESRLTELPEKSIIFFWASSTLFNINLTEKQVNRENKLDVLNAARHTVGSVRKTETPQWKAIRRGDVSCCEFIAIGRRCIPEIPDIPPQVLALQIVWEDSIAYRVSIAEIDEQAWLNTNPQWKLIAMM
jgi:hypothetical protein